MSWIVIEYGCPDCGLVTESLESRASAPSSIACDCGATATRRISAPLVTTPIATVQRGHVEEPPPGAFSTRHLAKPEHR